jgi:hypothetical protein
MTPAVLAQILKVCQLVVEIGQQALDAGKEFGADLAQLKASGGTVEQANAQFVLQLPDGLAYRGLRHAEEARRPAEAAGLDDGRERSQLTQIIYRH